MPTFLECQRCGACCRWPGGVRIADRDVTRISAHLGLSEQEFVALHTRLHPDRRGLVLNEKPRGECIFLEGNVCAIQAVKPQQCRDFPNLWTHPAAASQCKALPREVHESQYERLIAAATGRVGVRRPPDPPQS